MARDRATAEYERLHWGMSHRRESTFPDAAPDLTGRAPALCALLEVIFGDDAESLQFSDGCQLIVGRTAPHRLYAGLTPKMATWSRRHLWSKATVPVWDLAGLAQEIGGRQNRLGYESVRVKPIAEVYSVLYQTAKGGDYEADGSRPSVYEHQFGQNDSGDGGTIKPWLAVSADGRLWFAGGDAKVTTHGIED